MYDTLTAEELARFAQMFPDRVRQAELGILTDEDVRSLMATGQVTPSLWDN